MQKTTEFLSATPILASLDIARTVAFYEDKLGFTSLYAAPAEYAVLRKGAVSIHFSACTDPSITEATACRVQVQGIQALYEQCQREQIVHPNAQLRTQPWGCIEFGMLDFDKNLVTFYEHVDAPSFES
jgi:hypothetical protein